MQIGIGALVVLIPIVLQPSLVWWAIIVLAISFVLATELLNSAFEALIDRLHPERHPEIGIIKDIAAGGVLISSLGSGRRRIIAFGRDIVSIIAMRLGDLRLVGYVD